MRQIIKLNGLWDFTPALDPDYRGSTYKDPDWDRRNWEKVKIPGCWNKYREKYALFEGVAWYAREFHIDYLDSSNAMAYFRFDAVNYLTKIYLNGEQIGEHEGGYTQFQVEGVRFLKEGRNVLVLSVDNRQHIIKFPGVIGWFNYGGIGTWTEVKIP